MANGHSETGEESVEREGDSRLSAVIVAAVPSRAQSDESTAEGAALQER